MLQRDRSIRTSTNVSLPLPKFLSLNCSLARSEARLVIDVLSIFRVELSVELRVSNEVWNSGHRDYSMSACCHIIHCLQLPHLIPASICTTPRTAEDITLPATTQVVWNGAEQKGPSFPRLAKTSRRRGER